MALLNLWDSNNRRYYMLLTVWDKKDIHSPSPPLSMCGGKKISEMENALRVLPRRHSTKIGRGEERKHRAVWR